MEKWADFISMCCFVVIICIIIRKHGSGEEGREEGRKGDNLNLRPCTEA